jgi:hypothetical protein
MAISHRDLARKGHALGETGGELYKTTLRAFASPQSNDFGNDSSGAIEFVAAQVLDEADPDATAGEVLEYVEAFVELYDFETQADVFNLLQRESFERTNYEGQLAFAAEGK